jgi:hypothetical protein
MLQRILVTTRFLLYITFVENDHSIIDGGSLRLPRRGTEKDCILF